MLFPSPLFHMREFGAALEGGWMCPQCKGDRLRVTKAGTHPEPDELTCPSCGGQYRSGWRRHVWRSEVPQAVRGTPADNLGGFFETLQHYPARPELPAPGEERNVHLADFVIDLDRETLPAAQVDVLTLHAYLDALAPGQVRLYYSGSKGFHVVVPWQTLGAVPSPDLVQRDYRFLAARIHRETGVMPDYKLYSPDRMLRLPDTWHGKTGRYKVEVLPEEVWECEFLSMSPRGVLNTAPAAVAPGLAALYATAREEAEETRERLGDLTPRLDFKGSSLRGADPHCVQYLKAKGLPYKGSRHQVYLMLARYWLSQGVPLEEYGSFGKVTGGALVRAREFAQREDPNTDTPLSVRVRDFDQSVRYVYGQGWRFDCAGPKEIGICDPHCPIRSIGAHPLAHLLGLSA